MDNIVYGTGERKVKCKFCGIADTPKKELIWTVRETPKSKLNEYFHEECYPQHLAHKAFKEKERKEQDELNETLKDVLMRPQMGAIWSLLAQVRNGEELGLINGRQKSNRYKEGVTYAQLNEAFKYSKADIQYALRTKNFDSSFTEFKYALQIAVGNLIHIETKEEKLERTKKHLEIMNANEDLTEEDLNPSFKPTEDENDISFLLD